MSASNRLGIFRDPGQLNDESGGTKTDVEISKSFGGVTDAILSWVDNIDAGRRPYVYDDLVTRDKTTGDYDHLKPLGLWRDHRDDAWMNWLSKYDTRNSVILSLVIWHFLQSRIFESFFPIHDGTEKIEAASWQRFVELVVNEMKTADHNDRAVLAGVWRSTAMKAFIEYKQREDQRIPAAKGLFEEMLEELRHWIREKALSQPGIKDMLREKVFKSSLTLHDDMKTSQQDYALRPANFRHGQLDQKPQDAEGWTLISIKRWITTKYATVDGLFYPLFPALYRLGGGEEDELVLVKPVVMAFKDPSRFARLQPEQTDDTSSPDESSGLASPQSEKSVTNRVRVHDRDELSRPPEAEHFNMLPRSLTAPAALTSKKSQKSGRDSHRNLDQHRRRGSAESDTTALVRGSDSRAR